jgi:CheY-like chemotaxis protein
MGGAINASRSPAGGARIQFSVTLPLCDQTQAEKASERTPPTPHETIHVLVVDDNATNRFVASRVLKLFGCTSEVAENGKEAVAAVEAQNFDLVLMDVKMPIMDGVAATRWIRSLPGPASRVPILALTANADPKDAIEYLAAGMDGVVSKPIQPDLLLDAIRQVLSGPEELSDAA